MISSCFSEIESRKIFTILDPFNLFSQDVQSGGRERCRSKSRFYRLRMGGVARYRVGALQVQEGGTAGRWCTFTASELIPPPTAPDGGSRTACVLDFDNSLVLWSIRILPRALWTDQHGVRNLNSVLKEVVCPLTLLRELRSFSRGSVRVLCRLKCRNVLASSVVVPRGAICAWCPRAPVDGSEHAHFVLSNVTRAKPGDGLPYTLKRNCFMCRKSYKIL